MPQRPPSETNNGRAKIYLGLFVSLACLTWVALSVEREDVFQEVKNVEPGFLILAVLATIISYILRAWRWPLFFERNAPSFADSFRCLIIGFFMNNVLPARVGEFVRAHLGGAATKQSRSSVLATIAGERLADGLVISGVFAICFLAQGRAPGSETHGNGLLYVALLFFAAAIFTIIVLITREPIFRVLERLGRIMPGHLSNYTLVRLRRFVDGLEPMFRPSRAMSIAIASLVVWGVELVAYYFVTRAFDEPLSVAGLTLFLAAVNFSSLIPAAPAGAGVIELVATQALGEIGVPRATGLAMVTAQHLIQIAVVGVPGALFFFRGMGGKLPQKSDQLVLDEEGLEPPPSFAEISEPRPAVEEKPTPDEPTVPEQDLVDISIVIPAYNEEQRLPKTLLAAYEYMRDSGRSYEILVVDDGSKDDTARVVKQFESLTPTVRLLTYPHNRGKGYAVRFGMLNSRGKLMLFDDADGATPIAEVERLLVAMKAGAQVAIGSRAMFSVETGVRTVWYRKMLGRVFNAMVNIVILPGIADTQCGFKLFTREAGMFIFRRQKAERFSFDVEVLYLARRAGFRIAEVPINWTNVPGSKVNIMRDSLAMARDTVKFRLRDFFGGYGSHVPGPRS